VILVRLGIVSEATGPTELAEWLAGLDTTEAELEEELEPEEQPGPEGAPHDPA
jgi:hypothetical protein